MQSKIIKYILVLLVFLLFTNLLQAAPATATPAEIIDESIEILKEMSGSEDSGAFGALLKEAEGVAIFPSIIKVGVGIGGQLGEGMILRKDNKTGVWYGPAFAEIKSISVGPQVGIQSVALILVITNERGMEGFMEDNLTLGASASIAVGPVGRSLSADTDYKLKASIYSYSISKGAYLGASFQGSTIEEDEKANELFYGEALSNRTILENRVAVNPAVLDLLRLIKEISK